MKYYYCIIWLMLVTFGTRSVSYAFSPAEGICTLFCGRHQYIFSIIKILQTCIIRLTLALVSYQKWFTANRLSLNIDKTVIGVMLITVHHRPPPSSTVQYRPPPSTTVQYRPPPCSNGEILLCDRYRCDIIYCN